MEDININKYMKRFDYSNPLHLMGVGAILLLIVLLKTFLLIIAITVFAVAIYFMYNKKKVENDIL